MIKYEMILCYRYSTQKILHAYYWLYVSHLTVISLSRIPAVIYIFS